MVQILEKEMLSNSPRCSSSKKFEMLCAAMIGFGQLFVMVGFDSESFILESVIHSIHEREPARISAYAGYYGQATLYASYMLVCFFSPSIISLVGPKKTLILAAVCFSSFPVGFLFFNQYYYYFSSALLGAGLSLYYQGTGGYSTSHSTRETIETNVSFGWSIGCCCFFVGASIMAGIISWTSGSQSESVGGHAERRFSDSEITSTPPVSSTLLFSAFSFFGFLGVVNYLLIPSEDVPNCIEPSKSKRHGAWTPLSLSLLHCAPFSAIQFHN